MVTFGLLILGVGEIEDVFGGCRCWCVLENGSQKDLGEGFVNLLIVEHSKPGAN